MAPTTVDPEKSLRVLICGTDRGLEDEFLGALAGVPDRHGVVHFADGRREAVEAARRRQPAVIVIEVDRHVDEMIDLARELLETAPGAALVGAFLPDHLDPSRSESEVIIDLMRAQVRDFLRRPLAATELRAVLDRLFTRSTAAPASDEGRVAAFMSGKGGVGKSTLAVNVASCLALRHPDDVLLIDASLQVGSCAFLLDLKPATSIVDAIRERDRLDRTLLRHLSLRHDTGLRLLAAPADLLEGAEIDDEAIARILTLARRTFKYVIVDTFPMLDNVLMTVLDLTDVACVVVQGTAPAVAGASRLLPVLEGLGLSAARQRLVLNYNYRPFLGNLKPIDIADRLQRTIDYVVPYEKNVLISGNTGSPEIIRAGRWQRFGRTIREIADDLEALTVGAGRDRGAGEADLRPRDEAAVVGNGRSRTERRP